MRFGPIPRRLSIWEFSTNGCSSGARVVSGVAGSTFGTRCHGIVAVFIGFILAGCVRLWGLFVKSVDNFADSTEKVFVHRHAEWIPR